MHYWPASVEVNIHSPFYDAGKSLQLSAAPTQRENSYPSIDVIRSKLKMKLNHCQQLYNVLGKWFMNKTIQNITTNTLQNCGSLLDFLTYQRKMNENDSN